MVAEKIESCLKRLLSLAITFLARILNLGGVGDKIGSTIERARKPIFKALDRGLNLVAKATAPIWNTAKKGFDKAKGLYDKGTGWAKGRVELGKATLSRLFKKSFSVAGTTHSVKAKAVAGKLRLSVASKEELLPTHQRNAAAMATQKGKPQLAKRRWM